jgi:hypothetical protein
LFSRTKYSFPPNTRFVSGTILTLLWPHLSRPHMVLAIPTRTVSQAPSLCCDESASYPGLCLCLLAFSLRCPEVSLCVCAILGTEADIYIPFYKSYKNSTMSVRFGFNHYINTTSTLCYRLALGGFKTMTIHRPRNVNIYINAEHAS